MKTSVTIQNLKCGGCESTIAKKLHTLKGIKDVFINQEDCTISFSYKTEDGFETVQKELTKLGYPIKGNANPIGSKFKSYLSCAIGKINK
ncbi:heavy-metal-associated domain-containing protein [Aquimarina pacifica]|uniref:heavy-metal-associated domain-containing protein n=1 Tax=Aquimarina pacifica TaxID=1296415 RepID=UPI000471B783|nr:heavy-metal-associated domain-containing protein [Aquimarina pacifica]